MATLGNTPQRDPQVSRSRSPGRTRDHSKLRDTERRVKEVQLVLRVDLDSLPVQGIAGTTNNFLEVWQLGRTRTGLPSLMEALWGAESPCPTDTGGSGRNRFSSGSKQGRSLYSTLHCLEVFNGSKDGKARALGNLECVS